MDNVEARDIEPTGDLTATQKTGSGIGLPLMLHFAFKLGALITYFCGPTIFGRKLEFDFVFTFVLTVIWLSCDFWAVKNITGWRLTGMTWFYSESDEVENCTANDKYWYFQYDTDKDAPNQWQAFWAGLTLWPIFWIITAFSNFFSLAWDWFVVAMIGLTLSSINFTGYWKCSKNGSTTSFQSWVTDNPLIKQMSNIMTFLPLMSKAHSIPSLPK